MATVSPLLADLVAAGITSVPQSYVRPPSDRPNLHHISNPSHHSIPLIDLGALSGPRRSDVVREIGDACQTYGFFQVQNHGIPEEVMEKMMAAAAAYFRLPESERMKDYSDDPLKATRLSTSFNVRTEKASCWRDYLRFRCYPLQDHIHDWPSNPPFFRNDVAEYCTAARGLALRLLEAISESLGLTPGYIGQALGRHGQHVAINYYPPCPQPELTYGLPVHTDPNAITLLLQQNHVAGLQVLKEGRWVSVAPVPGALIVNIGDQVQVLSNGRYHSVLHRAVVNRGEDRISIPTFYCPSLDAVMGPAPPLVDEQHPQAYRSFTYGEYFTEFWNRGLATETCLHKFRAVPFAA